MAVSPSLADLAGFTTAHALWNLSDLPEDDLLCPMAFVSNGTERDLLRFESDSQDEAIKLGFQTLGQRQDLASWAFAYQGCFQMESGPVEVLIVQAWSVGMDSPVTFLQQYRPFSSGVF